MLQKGSLFQIALLVFQFTQAREFDFNDKCKEAYNSIIAMKLEQAEAMLSSEKNGNPKNLIPVYLENYIDFLRIYTGDSHAQYDQLKKNKEQRLTLLSEGDKRSPYCLYALAEVNMQWATMEIKFGEYLAAVWGIRKAFKLLEENEKRFPDFKPNKKLLGVLYALLGSVPEKYKWGLAILGLEGDIEKGLGYLRQLTEDKSDAGYIYKNETVIYYSFLLFHLQNEGEKAWQVLMENGFPEKDNLFSAYACAYIGIYGKHTDEALGILDNYPEGKEFSSFPYLKFLKGLGELHRLNPQADIYFKQYIAEYKGDNLKNCLHKLAWCYLIKGDTINYIHFLTKGRNSAVALADAEKEDEGKRIPDVGLLRARMLFDGGYYQKAQEEMKNINERNLRDTEDQTEYLYRFGRICDEQNKQDSALSFYRKAIESGKNLHRYFAANSALESGKIYEAKGEKGNARYYYELCISFESHEYKQALDIKVMAGLNRLKGK